jgi:hypothetical protein
LTGKLKRAAPFLRTLGIGVEFPKREHTGRKIKIKKLAEKIVTSVTQDGQRVLTNEIPSKNNVTVNSYDAVAQSSPAQELSSRNCPSDDLMKKGDDPIEPDRHTPQPDKVLTNKQFTVCGDDGDAGVDQISIDSEPDDFENLREVII